VKPAKAQMKKITAKSLCFEDWKTDNPGKDEKKFEYYWRKRSLTDKQAYEVRASALTSK